MYSAGHKEPEINNNGIEENKYNKYNKNTTSLSKKNTEIDIAKKIHANNNGNIKITNVRISSS